jgi:predicted O-methyltransferase YrrM
MNILLSVWKSRFNLPRRVFSKLIKFYAKKFGYCQVTVKNQSHLFESVSLNRAAGLSRLNEVTEQVFNLSYSEDNGMFSEHLILFAAIAQSKVKISSILEIGTFDGRTAVILSKLFPQAIVTTIDLD